MCFSHAEALSPLSIRLKKSTTAVNGLTMVQHASITHIRPLAAKSASKDQGRIRTPRPQTFRSRHAHFALSTSRWLRLRKQAKRGNNHGSSRQGSQSNRPMGTMLNVNLGLRHMDSIGKMSYDLLLLSATVFPGCLRRWPSSKMSPSEQL